MWNLECFLEMLLNKFRYMSTTQPIHLNLLAPFFFVIALKISRPSAHGMHKFVGINYMLVMIMKTLKKICWGSSHTVEPKTT